jgi:enoyl-CoA hydratase/carnithine racemase
VNWIQNEKRNSGLLIWIDRPQALGALDAECFEAIEAALESARHDPQIHWVAFRSRHPKAFCAGGDVRRLYSEFQRTQSLEYSEKFFETEYRVDQKVWDFPKPIIALTQGITMGGGIGLIRGAHFRVVTPSSLLAMPEVSIGLYPDVGATFFLHSVPSPWRELVAFCGARFGAQEALEWGVATHCVRDEDLDRLTAELDSEVPIAQVLQSFSMTIQSAPRRLPTRLPVELSRAFSHRTPAEIWDHAAALLHSGELASEITQPLELLLGGSPISCAVIHEQLARGGRLSRPQAFEWEYHLSLACMRSGDFMEGVRMRLVEKGSAPRWKYAHPSEIPAALITLIAGDQRG